MTAGTHHEAVPGPVSTPALCKTCFFHGSVDIGVERWGFCTLLNRRWFADRLETAPVAGQTLEERLAAARRIAFYRPVLTEPTRFCPYAAAEAGPDTAA